AERLRHVVVGTRVERRDLLVLVADRGEHDDGDAAPRAQLPRDLCPGPVRKHEVQDHRLRLAERGRSERLLRRRGGLDLVAGAAQVRRQRPQDLWLVVDDEHAWGAAHACTGASRRAGSASTKRPPSGDASAQSRAPFASANPRAIARPSPVPPAGPWWNGWKT